MDNNLTEYRVDYFLSAAECNAQQEISLPLLAQRLIDISTAHASAIGVGYEHLLKDNNAWVLSRVSVELTRFPSINKSYSLITWVEDINRHFSERIVEIRDDKDETIGYGRLTWVAINIVTRRPADLTSLLDKITPSKCKCPIERHPRLVSLGIPDHVTMYKFQYSDIDFNRHVNSTRYIQFILDRWGVNHYDLNRVSRFDISYHSEAHFEDVVEVRCKGDEETQDVEIARDGVVCTRARIKFCPRSLPIIPAAD
ncbi:MAG: hypothetical protein K2L55_02670 [Muribaculaceae bacterium]|nr:hypothetical protein [Muribaculaceae bacterium]